MDALPFLDWMASVDPWGMRVRVVGVESTHCFGVEELAKSSIIFFQICFSASLERYFL